MWLVNQRFEVHYGSPSPSEQRRPEVFTETQTQGKETLSRLGDQLASQIASLWRSAQASQGRNGPCPQPAAPGMASI